MPITAILNPLKKKISHIILAAQHSVPKAQNNNFQNTTLVSFENVMVPASEGAMLDTLVIKPRDLKDTDSAPHVIYFCGMRGCYTRKVERYAERAAENKHVAICFNYRNVGNSTGTVYSQEELIADGVAQVEYLLQKNIPPAKIFLYGLSLGGAIATIITASYHDKGQRIRLINDRSFTRIADALPPPFFKWRNWITFFIGHLWELNALEAMKRINKDDVFIIAAEEDTLIDFNRASLYQALLPDLKETYPTTYETVIRSFQVSNGAVLNQSKGDRNDPESKYGVHGALLEKLIDKNERPMIQSIFQFIQNNPVKFNTNNDENDLKKQNDQHFIFN